MEPDRIADCWVEFWRSERTPKAVADFDATERVNDLVRENADVGLEVILKILDRIEAVPTETLFQVLAAGPLEDLLAHHGPLIIDQVETQAREDARFNLLLGGVWPSSIAPNVWARVQTARREVW